MKFKRLLIFGLLTMILAPFMFAEDSKFLEANAKYQAGDFKTAAAEYESLLRSGQRTAAVYFNLGNAEFRLKRKGRALLAYERALLAAPRDKDIRWNIEVLKSVLPDRVDSGDENIVSAWIKSLIDFASIDEWSWALGVLLGILVAAALAIFTFQKARSFFSAIQFLTMVLLALLAVILILKWWDVKDKRVVILDKEVYARYGPSDKETTAFLLHEGAEAKSADESRDWTYVVLKNKNSGWIKKESCEVI